MFSSVKSKDVLLSIPTGRSINSEHYTATLSATKLPLVRLLTNPVLGRPWSCNWYPKQVPSVTFPNTVFCRKDCVWSLNKLENGGEFSFCVRKSTCSITWHFGRPFLMAGLLASYSLHLSFFLHHDRFQHRHNESPSQVKGRWKKPLGICHDWGRLVQVTSQGISLMSKHD